MYVVTSMAFIRERIRTANHSFDHLTKVAFLSIWNRGLRLAQDAALPIWLLWQFMRIIMPGMCNLPLSDLFAGVDAAMSPDVREVSMRVAIAALWPLSLALDDVACSERC